MPELTARTAAPFIITEPLPWLQVPMEPMRRSDDTYGRGQAAEFHGVAGWPAQPKLLPTVITCEPLLVIAAGLAAAADLGWKCLATSVALLPLLQPLLQLQSRCEVGRGLTTQCLSAGAGRPFYCPCCDKA